MSPSTRSNLASVLKQHEEDILAEWMQRQLSSTMQRADLVSETTLRDESRQLLNALRNAVQEGDGTDINTPQWKEVKDLLARHVAVTRPARLQPVRNRALRILAEAATVRAIAQSARRGP